MTGKMENLISEIIRKECERYRLVEWGLLSSVEEETDILCSLLSLPADETWEDRERFKQWRKELLTLFYSRMDYAGFLQKQKDMEPFQRFLFFMRKRMVDRLWQNNTLPTIDADLVIPPYTLAYKFSKMVAQDENILLFREFNTIKSPLDLESRCEMACGRRYPLGLNNLFHYLKKEDKEFWSVIYLLVKKMAEYVTSNYLFSKLYKEETIADIWSDVSLLLHDKTVAGLLPVFETGAHFRHYIGRICMNKCYEAERRNAVRKEFVSLDDPVVISDVISQSIDTNSCLERVVDMGNPLLDVDMQNEYEVKCAFMVVLWDRSEPWYSKLVSGLENKVEVLRLYYIGGQSYREIAIMQLPGGSDNDIRKLENKLRQDVSRVRKILKERFMEMLLKGGKED
ncbi:hypothetical protein M1P97_00500 [Parabacteroides sp. GYB001]|uniref:RNA polymerase sigma factor n=2 Tax=Parabacteroides leei TaxID=2939491 RepID=UPI002016F1B3|nr:hypothetical protein [Parabacteroides leei]MCL3849770.1 hypothetical protein [Parabacteroides leei]